MASENGLTYCMILMFRGFGFCFSSYKEDFKAFLDVQPIENSCKTDGDSLAAQ